MDLIFNIISADDYPANLTTSFTFKKAGGTIGRGEYAEWFLPDTKRQISNIHATISFDDDSYFITDNSTNGTFLDGEDAPLNKGEAHPIHHGDSFKIGNYLMQVTLVQDPEQYAADKETLRALIPDDSFLDDEPVDELLESDQDLQNLQIMAASQTEEKESDDSLLKEHIPSPVLDHSVRHEAGLDEIPEDFTINGDFTMHESKGVNNNDPVNERNDVNINNDIEAEPFNQQSSASQARNNATTTQQYPDSVILSALSKGLGVNFPQHTDQQQLAHDIGVLLRQSVGGLQQLLRTRAEMKNSLRGKATTIQGQGNNPLKFSHDASEALNILLAKKRGFLTGPEAITQGCNDIQAHQLAINDASQHMVQELIEKLSPQTLTYRFIQEGVKASFGRADAKYWRAYSQLHEKIQNDAEWRNALLEQDFAKHYETHLQLLNTALRA
ncbi:type VI secretion system-associated FHA domain protein TagH [Photobacterium lipolyticum]|uniref:Type VI secretion system-associated FHA domain protein TagH n=1 Tax=Photobacterium lipolyticum TaxID=266810 RepID=A0A2T3MZ16_9GAMM|nr:type VI secretion system-associated FHA domain protein TagH [Photobacterium lipolyticum]PSW05099.1 type VI secretion system-associated FHA domain protein TagH [Photobacterium lipolyticum]